MTLGVGADQLGNARGHGGAANGALDDGFVQVVATNFPTCEIGVRAGCGKDPLPDPFFRGGRRPGRGNRPPRTSGGDGGAHGIGFAWCQCRDRIRLCWLRHRRGARQRRDLGERTLPMFVEAALDHERFPRHAAIARGVREPVALKDNDFIFGAPKRHRCREDKSCCPGLSCDKKSRTCKPRAK